MYQSLRSLEQHAVADSHWSGFSEISVCANNFLVDHCVGSEVETDSVEHVPTTKQDLLAEYSGILEDSPPSAASTTHFLADIVTTSKGVTRSSFSELTKKRARLLLRIAEASWRETCRQTTTIQQKPLESREQVELHLFYILMENCSVSLTLGFLYILTHTHIHTCIHTHIHT